MELEEIPASGEMTRRHRIVVGATVYGLYMLGMAMTDCDRVDEDCAMDNMRVPYRYEDLNESARKALRGENWMF